MGLTIGLTFVLATVSLISIFAVMSLTGQSATVLVSYSVVPPEGTDDSYYAGKISLYYKLAGDSVYTLASGDASFNKNDVNPSGFATSSITNEEIELSEEHPYFILCWKVENTTQNSVNYQTKKFNVKLDYLDTEETDKKVTIRYTDSYAILSSSYTSGGYMLEKIQDTSITRAKSLGNLTYVSSTTIDVDYVYFYYVKVTIEDKYEDAVFSGDFTWTITEAT